MQHAKSFVNKLVAEHFPSMNKLHCRITHVKMFQFTFKKPVILGVKGLPIGLFWDERRRKILPSFPFQSAAEIPRYKVNELSAFASFRDLSFDFVEDNIS